MPVTALKRPPLDPKRKLALETEAATILRDQLKTVYGVQRDEEMEDNALLLGMIEGETDLLETMDTVLAQIALDGANIEGIKKFAQALAARKDRLERRTETLRTMLVNALEILEQKKFERPLATLTLKDVAPKLEVTDEAAVPSQWWKPADPTLDRKGLGDFLKGRQKQIEELNEQRRAKAITDEQYAAKLAVIEAAYPVIPGAELGNGGVTVQIRFS